MAQELLSYADLAQRLNLSTTAAKVIAIGLRLPRYAAPDGRTVVLCNVAELRGPQDEGQLEAGPVLVAVDATGELAATWALGKRPYRLASGRDVRPILARG